MPSDTKPMPAQELLRLADAMVEATHAYHAFLHDASAKMSARILSDAEMMPIRDSIQRHADAIADATEAYRAARQASPVTLEEALMVAEIVAHDTPIAEPGGSASEYLAAMRARHEYARTLAAKVTPPEQDQRGEAPKEQRKITTILSSDCVDNGDGTLTTKDEFGVIDGRHVRVPRVHDRP